MLTKTKVTKQRSFTFMIKCNRAVNFGIYPFVFKIQLTNLNSEVDNFKIVLSQLF